MRQYANRILSLQTIAQQCPLSAGHAVLQARALIAVVNEEVVNYNDDLSFGGQLIQAPQEGSVSATEMPRELIVFPNPAKDELMITFPAILQEKANLELYDSQGRTLKIFMPESGIRKFPIMVDELSAGLYFLTLKTDRGKYSCKLIVL